MVWVGWGDGLAIGCLGGAGALAIQVIAIVCLWKLGST